MLAIVASTPKAAAGLAILRERSDMGVTLPGRPAWRSPRWAGAEVTAHRSHVLLPIFFGFSYPLLGFPLEPSRSMEDMQRSTFRTSPIERDRGRAAGTARTLVAGTATSVTTSRVLPSWHPASEGFTPDGTSATTRLRLVQDSEPGSPTLRSTSRGSASPDSVGTASPGSGPNVRRSLLLGRIAQFLEATAGDPPAHGSDSQIRQVH